MKAVKLIDLFIAQSSNSCSVLFVKEKLNKNETPSLGFLELLYIILHDVGQFCKICLLSPWQSRVYWAVTHEISVLEILIFIQFLEFSSVLWLDAFATEYFVHLTVPLFFMPYTQRPSITKKCAFLWVLWNGSILSLSTFMYRLAFRSSVFSNQYNQHLWQSWDAALFLCD